MSVADTVSEIVRRVSAEAPEDERIHAVLREIRALPNIEELDGPLAFRSGDVEIQVGLIANLEKAKKSLDEVRSLKLSIAPEVVAHLPFSGAESVLVTRYAACEGERLLPVRPSAPGQGSISEASRERAKKDLLRLSERGLIHPWAARGFAPWLVSSESKTLVLSGWTELRPADADERASQLERAGALLGRLA